MPEHVTPDRADFRMRSDGLPILCVVVDSEASAAAQLPLIDAEDISPSIPSGGWSLMPTLTLTVLDGPKRSDSSSDHSASTRSPHQHRTTGLRPSSDTAAQVSCSSQSLIPLPHGATAASRCSPSRAHRSALCARLPPGNRGSMR